MAGGFTIERDNIDNFRDSLIKSYEKINKNTQKNENLYLDSIIAPSALNEKFFADINTLAPFGSGNREPKFVIEDLKVLSSDIIGNIHIKTTLLGKDGTVLKGFAWNAKNTILGKHLNKEQKKRINIAGNMRLNEWRGKKEIEFIIEDIALN